MTKREMTIEEAIEIFKEVRAEVLAKETELSKQVFENLGIKAVDLAIKILEQQPCEDCVSRQAVLDEKWTHTHPDGFAEEYVTVKDILELPSVTPSYNSIKTELEPCDDCISRKRLLARIDEERKHLLDIKMDGAEHIIVHHARRIIEDMPSVTPKGVTITDFADRCRECGRIKSSNLQDWLSTFNTESATECFTAVQQLKERMNE